MKNTIVILLSVLIIFGLYSSAKANDTRFVHVFVALVDNDSQGIVPVPELIGDGNDPRNNLYWGALYGIKTYFNKSSDWKLVKKKKNLNDIVLERLVYKHATKDVYMVADAYRGTEIKTAIDDFLKASSGEIATSAKEPTLTIDGKDIKMAGNADLVAYIGHNGLMEFTLKNTYFKKDEKKREAIILACYSRDYFTKHLKTSGAEPLLWTTHLMAPEAYTLKAALDGWIAGEKNSEIRMRAVAAYRKHQGTGLRATKGLLVTGW